MITAILEIKILAVIMLDIVYNEKIDNHWFIGRLVTIID